MYLYKTWMGKVPSLTTHPNLCCKVFLSLSSETLVHWGTRTMNWLFISVWPNSNSGLMGFMCFDWVLRLLKNLQGEWKSLKWCLQLDNFLGRQLWHNQTVQLLEVRPAHPRSQETSSLLSGPAGQLCSVCCLLHAMADTVLSQCLVSPHYTPTFQFLLCSLQQNNVPSPHCMWLARSQRRVELIFCQSNACVSHTEI